MSWKGIISALLFVLTAAEVSAQQQYVYRVSFTDKNNTPYTLSNPIAYLSQRAIDRRNAQSISIDSTDIPVPDTYIQGVLIASGGILHTRSRWFNHITILIDNPGDITAVQALPYVSNVADIGFYSSGLHNRIANNENELPTLSLPPTTGLPPILAKSTGSPAYYGNTWDQTTMVNGDYLHDQGFKGEGMLIAVLDDGYVSVPTHEVFDSLNLQNRIVETHNFANDTNYIYNLGSNHGAAVLAQIAGNKPGTYVGSAPNASYALYVTEKLGSEMPVEMENVVAGIERADSIGADVISHSSGYNTFEAPYTGQNLSLSDLDGKTTFPAKAANLATKKGMLYVATAGNDGNAGLLTPGDADSVLTVGAVRLDQTPYLQSGYGPNGAGHIKPDVVTLGDPAAVITVGGMYSTGSGTSYSTPQMAGWATCLWQAKPQATPRMLRAAIDTSAHIHTAPEVQRGFGIPNFQTAASLLNVENIITGMKTWVTAGPNPCTGDISFWTNLPISDDVSYQLTDIRGKVILTSTQRVDSGIHSTKVPLPKEMGSGIYFLKVTTNNRNSSIKIVKN
jgi:serine protease AprX